MFVQIITLLPLICSGWPVLRIGIGTVTDPDSNLNQRIHVLVAVVYSKLDTSLSMLSNR